MTDLQAPLNRLIELGDLDRTCSLTDDQDMEFVKLCIDNAPRLAKALQRAIRALKGVEDLPGRYTRAYGPDDNSSRIADLLTMDAYQLGAQGLESIRDALEITND